MVAGTLGTDGEAVGQWHVVGWDLWKAHGLSRCQRSADCIVTMRARWRSPTPRAPVRHTRNQGPRPNIGLSSGTHRPAFASSPPQRAPALERPRSVPSPSSEITAEVARSGFGIHRQIFGPNRAPPTRPGEKPRSAPQQHGRTGVSLRPFAALPMEGVLHGITAEYGGSSLRGQVATRAGCAVAGNTETFLANGCGSPGTRGVHSLWIRRRNGMPGRQKDWFAQAERDLERQETRRRAGVTSGRALPPNRRRRRR